MFRALGLVLLAIGVFKLRSSKGRVEDAFENELPLIRPLARQLGWNIDDSKLVHHIEQAFSLSATTLTWIAVGLLVYAGLQVIEWLPSPIEGGDGNREFFIHARAAAASAAA